MQRAAFGGKHAAVLRVDAHSRPALIGEAVRIHTDGLVNHNNTRFRGYERWVSDTLVLGGCRASRPESECKGTKNRIGVFS